MTTSSTNFRIDSAAASHVSIDNRMLFCFLLYLSLCDVMYKRQCEVWLGDVNRSKAKYHNLNKHTCIHTYMHTYVHTCIQTYLHTYVQNYIHVVHACTHTYMHAYMYTFTYIHTYLHTCVHRP